MEEYDDESPPAPSFRDGLLGAAVILVLATAGAAAGVGSWVQTTARRLGRRDRLLPPSPQFHAGDAVGSGH